MFMMGSRQSIENLILESSNSVEFSSTGVIVGTCMKKNRINPLIITNGNKKPKGN